MENNKRIRKAYAITEKRNHLISMVRGGEITIEEYVKRMCAIKGDPPQELVEAAKKQVWTT